MQQRASVAMLGIVAGLDGIGYAVALASLMFTGSLAAGLGVATGSALLCTAVVADSGAERQPTSAKSRTCR